MNNFESSKIVFKNDEKRDNVLEFFVGAALPAPPLRRGVLFLMCGEKSYLLYILGPFSPKQGGEQGGETALGWGFSPVSQPQTPI